MAHPTPLAQLLLVLGLVCSACSGSSVAIPGGDAGHTASGLKCDIDNVTGSFAVSYSKVSGDCGDVQGGFYLLTPGALWAAPGCTPKSKATSADGCSSTGSATCFVNGVSEDVSGSLEQMSNDLIQGTVQFQTTGLCQGSYSITYMRQ